MKTVCNLLQIDLQSPLVLELSWLEHLTVNQRVAGSSPAGGATKTQYGISFTGFFLGINFWYIITQNRLKSPSNSFLLANLLANFFAANL